MKIRMKAKISGTRNGADWPEADEVVDLPDSEAKELIAAGNAVDASDDHAGYDSRVAKPWESVGPAHGDYPDATNRTGPPLVDQVGQHTDQGITVNGDHLTDEVSETRPKSPKVPQDARVNPPVSVPESAAKDAPENAATRTDNLKAK